ncbi:hypothetical protein KL86PLE_100228 [uncultured Pleomorphomonas sp.]|uniref:Uncharacterized protein n=1 Tax=uncultured Pleomorphomonas sp. TaxID=442121 RepID=A0A212L1T7_9HYPH|nr:hypothetical protein [uncultured Pleomorphomonas sp.]SCM71476.1 hypothetical protein KL86PLE_100228 [uncultured Pleomorphomonas sp.]
MSQFDFGAIDPSSMSGTELAAALGSFRDALNSHHSGESRPSYVQEGMIWVSKAATPYTAYFFDGTTDIALFTIDPSTHAKTVPDYAPLASPGLSGTPTAPTQSAKNSSTRLATTAFVQGEKGYKRGVTVLTASTTLGSAHLGNLVVCNSASATTMTLPAASSYTQGILSLVNINTGLVTLSGSIIYDGATVTSLTLPAGASIDLVSNGTSWVAIQQTLPVKEDAEWITGTNTVPAPISPAQLDAAVAALAGGGAISYQEILTSGVWTKPADLSPDALIISLLWGGGGGGYNSGASRGGGGGGSCAWAIWKASALPDEVSVTIGAGGGPASAGGTTYFNDLYAVGGAGGTSATSVGGDSGFGAAFAGGAGGSGASSPSAGGNSIWGGAGGAGQYNSITRAGGNSIIGGDGSGNLNSFTPEVPGGGGSNNASGAAGMVRLFIIE